MFNRRRGGIIGSVMELYETCLSLPPGYCINVPGELIRSATTEHELGAAEIWFARSPMPSEVKAFVTQISENWGVVIQDQMVNDYFNIYKPKKDSRSE